MLTSQLRRGLANTGQVVTGDLDLSCLNGSGGNCRSEWMSSREIREELETVPKDNFLVITSRSWKGIFFFILFFSNMEESLGSSTG